MLQLWWSKPIKGAEKIKNVVGWPFGMKNQNKLSLGERLEPLIERLATYPRSGFEAHKAFFDWLSGESDDELVELEKK